MRRLPFINNRYLSTYVEKDKPNYLKAPKLYRKILDLFENHWLWFLGPLIFVLLFLLIDFFNIYLNWVILSQEFFKIILTIPLALVAVIIPVITLAISYIGLKLDDEFKKAYIATMNPLNTYLLSIAYLAIIIILILFVSNEINAYFSKILVIVGLVSIIIPLLSTSLLVTKVINFLIEDFNYTPILELMKKELKEILDFEVSNSLFEELLKEKCEELDLRLDPGFKAEEDKYFEIDALSTGTLIDINLKKLENHVKLLEKKVSYGDQKVKGILVKHPNFFTKKHETLGYISNDQRIKAKVESSFIINKSYSKPKFSLYKFKKLVIRAIENDDEYEFEIALEIYFSGLRKHMEYVKMDEKSNHGLFLIFSNFDFEDIVRYTTRSKNTRLIAELSMGIHNLLKSAIDYNDQSIFDFIMLFHSIYIYSHKNQNMVGKDRCFHYPFKIYSYLLEKKSSEDLNFIFQIIDLLRKILKETIDFEDYECFKKTLETIDDILKEFTYIKNSNDHYLTIKKEIDAQKFEAGSYILKKIRDGKFKPENYKKYLDLLLARFNNFEDLLEVLEIIDKRESGQLNMKLSETMWEKDEYSGRELFAIDTIGRNLFLFCLKCIEIYPNFQSSVSLNNSNLIKKYFHRIEEFCKSIKSENEKWNWFIGDKNEKIDEFLDSVRNL